MPGKDFETSRENWWREEIPTRLAEMKDDPSIGIPAEQVFADLDERYRRHVCKAH